MQKTSSKSRKKEKLYYMYVVQCGDHTQSLYCGISTDPDRRLKEHNESKRGAKYTRSRRPVRLLFVQECGTRSEALKKEAAFKKLTRSKKLAYMCEAIEQETLLQLAKVKKVEVVETRNGTIQDTPTPDNDSG